MVRPIVATLTVLMVALAGCTGLPSGNEGEDDPSGTPTPSGPRQPTITFYTHEMNGTRPLEVEFHLDFTDVENRTIEWSLDVDSDGTNETNGTVRMDENVVHRHTYPDTGTVEATALATMDGRILLDQTLVIQVFTDQTTQRAIFTRDMQFESCSGPESYVQNGEVPFVGDETDVDPDDDDSEKIASRIDFKATKATWRQVYQAEWSFNGSFLEVYAFFTDSDGDIQDYDTDAGSRAGGNLTLHGRIPDPTVWVVLYACGGPSAITVEYLTPRPGTE